MTENTVIYILIIILGLLSYSFGYRNHKRKFKLIYEVNINLHKQNKKLFEDIKRLTFKNEMLRAEVEHFQEMLDEKRYDK